MVSEVPALYQHENGIAQPGEQTLPLNAPLTYASLDLFGPPPALSQTPNETTTSPPPPGFSAPPGLPALNQVDTPVRGRGPGENEIEKLMQICAEQPGNFDLSREGMVSLLAANGLSFDPILTSVLKNVTSVSKEGDTVELHRQQPAKIALNQKLMGGLIEVDSLDLGNTAFSLSSSGSGTRLQNVSGVSLQLTAFGKTDNVKVVDTSITQDAHGDTVITGQMSNPLPWEAQYVMAMKKTIPVSLTVTPEGEFSLPTYTSVLTSAANSFGNTFPGMVGHTELSNAASIANFVQRYPTWMNDTIYPYLKLFVKDAKQELSAPPSPRSQESSNNDNPEHLPSIPGKITHGGRYSQMIDVDGVERHYLLFVPSSYNPSKPLPLLVALHGLTGNSYQFETQSGLDAEAEKYGFIVAYPDATRWLAGSGTGGWTAWDTNNGIIPPGSQANDIQFIEAVFNDTQKEANIDPERIYLAGFSNGGMMTYDVISALSGKVAAIAVISGAMSGRETSPNEPISVINIHGTADTVIPYEGVLGVPNILSEAGLPTFQPFNYVAKYWMKEDGITSPPQTTVRGNQIIQTYNNPEDGAQVEQVTEIGGDHTPQDPKQEVAMAWQFLSSHTKIPLNAGDAPPTIKPIVDEPVNPANQILTDLQKRGTTGLESDADRVVLALSYLPNGSINPQSFLNRAGEAVKGLAGDPLVKFLSETNFLSKQGDHYAIGRNSTGVIPLAFKIPGSGGVASLSGLKVGSLNFDMNTDDHLLRISNVKGLSVNVDLAGIQLNSKIESMSERKFSNGSRQYTIMASQPMPGWARTILMEPSTIPIDVRFNSEGTPQVENSGQVEDSIIGKNPYVQGVYSELTDLGHLVTRPGLNSTGSVLTDAALTGGTTLTGYTAGQWADYALATDGGYARIAAVLGFMVAPALVGLIKRI